MKQMQAVKCAFFPDLDALHDGHGALGTSATPSKTRLILFHLPQFQLDPENGEWRDQGKVRRYIR
jgi:hypothetical protein